MAGKRHLFWVISDKSSRCCVWIARCKSHYLDDKEFLGIDSCMGNITWMYYLLALLKMDIKQDSLVWSLGSSWLTDWWKSSAETGWEVSLSCGAYSCYLQHHYLFWPTWISCKIKSCELPHFSFRSRFLDNWQGNLKSYLLNYSWNQKGVFGNEAKQELEVHLVTFLLCYWCTCT